ncbi:MAG: putative toxin-antitoxin system toxin component, PIN family [Chloroflexota bacterium]|nr:putative toxin-antitoxin system toxin component, PIN family [Chloroflexota bacterium]
MTESTLKAVVDTNLFVSALITRSGIPNALILAWRARRFQLLMSPAIRQEISTVLRRPRMRQRYGLAEEEMSTLLQLIDRRAIPVLLSTILPVTVRDPKDEMVLAAAIAGSADYLVTGDADLLVLHGDSRLGDLQIVTPRQFLERLAAEPVR